MNKKGILGLDTVKVVILTLLILGILAIVALVVLVPIRDSFENVAVSSGSAVNETTSAVVTSGSYTNLAPLALYRNPVCTLTDAWNATSNTKVAILNLSISGCAITNLGSTIVNNSKLNLTYTYTYSSPAGNQIVGNTSVGLNTFFSYVPTFFVLLAVVVLILVIAIVIVAVTRFGGSSQSQL